MLACEAMRKALHSLRRCPGIVRSSNKSGVTLRARSASEAEVVASWRQELGTQVEPPS